MRGEIRCVQPCEEVGESISRSIVAQLVVQAAVVIPRIGAFKEGMFDIE